MAENTVPGVKLVGVPDPDAVQALIEKLNKARTPSARELAKRMSNPDAEFKFTDADRDNIRIALTRDLNGALKAFSLAFFKGDVDEMRMTLHSVADIIALAEVQID